MEGRGGVKNLQRVNWQRIKNLAPDAGAENIVGMRWYGEATGFVDTVNDLASGPPFEIGQLRTKAKEVAILGGHFDAGDN